MSGDRAPLDVRPLRPEEVGEAIRVWHETKRIAYPYLPLEQGRTLAEDEAFFRAVILPRCEVWAALTAGELVGFLALAGDYVDRLYVHPRAQRAGVGAALLAAARRRSPQRLELHTHQANAQARAFYAREGFVEVELGISPPPECAPDVRLVWTRD